MLSKIPMGRFGKKEEAAALSAAPTSPPKPRGRPKTAKPTAQTQRPLFDEEDK